MIIGCVRGTVRTHNQPEESCLHTASRNYYSSNPASSTSDQPACRDKNSLKPVTVLARQIFFADLSGAAVVSSL